MKLSLFAVTFFCVSAQVLAASGTDNVNKIEYTVSADRVKLEFLPGTDSVETSHQTSSLPVQKGGYWPAGSETRALAKQGVRVEILNPDGEPGMAIYRTRVAASERVLTGYNTVPAAEAQKKQAQARMETLKTELKTTLRDHRTVRVVVTEDGVFLEGVRP